MVSWDGQKPSKPKRHRPQKCTKTCLLSGCRFEAPRAKKGKKTLRFKRNFRISSPTHFGWFKKWGDFGAQRGGKIAICARHSVSTKPPENKRETAGRVIWTHPRDQIPLLWSQNVTKSPSYSIYIYIYIYIYICCEVIIWAKFGHFRCYYLGQVGVIIWAKLFFSL